VLFKKSIQKTVNHLNFLLIVKTENSRPTISMESKHCSYLE